MTAPDTDSMSPSSLDPRTLGQRLRDGRLEKNLDIPAVAAAIRAPNGLVEAIERDDFGRLGAAIYVRGYLTSYARLVGVAESAVADVLDRRHDEPAPLQSSAQISHARYLLDRYARKGAYVVLTASIVLPLLWFKDQLKLQDVDLRSLDAPVESVLRRSATSGVPEAGDAPDVSDSPTGATVQPPLIGSPSEPAEDDLTVVASLAPFYTPRDEPAEAAPAIADAVAADGWLLQVTADSWVEVFAHDGRRLEYGLLHAGEQRRYPTDNVAGFAIGNATGVSLQRDGIAVDLEPFRRANVARFTVSSDGRLIPGNG